LGLSIGTATGVLDDAANRPARFALLTQKGRPALERGSAVIRDELKKIGLVVDVVPLDANALIQRLLSAKYDAIYFKPGHDRTPIPAVNPDFWFSSGTGHFLESGERRPPPSGSVRSTS